LRFHGHDILELASANINSISEVTCYILFFGNRGTLLIQPKILLCVTSHRSMCNSLGGNYTRNISTGP
jgi:hypothetical protein